MKLSFSTLGCPGWSLEQIVHHGAAMGFDGVELRIGGGIHVDPSFDAARRRSVRKQFEEAGLTITGLAGYTFFIGDDPGILRENAGALVRNAGLAADLGAPYVRTFIGDGELTGQGIAALRSAAGRCAALGVTALVETHDSLNSGDKVLDLLNRVGAEGLKVLWDIQHSTRAGEAPFDTWAALKADIRHIHIKDAGAGFEPRLMGEGVLPIAQAAAVSACNGYDGFYSFEWEKMWRPELDEPEISFPKYVRFMRSLAF